MSQDPAGDTRNLSLIVAASDNHVIGSQGKLPWRLSADLRRFKELTMGHHLIMGRKTFESIGRVLPGRTTVVLTRNPEFHPEGAVAATGIPQVLNKVAADPQPFVVGGAEIYRLLLPWVRRIYLTRVHCVVAGDAYWDPVDESQWETVSRQTYWRDDRNEFDFTCWEYERKVGSGTGHLQGAGSGSVRDGKF